MCYSHQYIIRQKNLKTDLDKLKQYLLSNKLSIPNIENLRVKEFDFQFEEKKKVFKEVKEFIERHEWLGKMSLYPTHIFTARYKGILSGVVVMDMPTAFSKLLGDDTKKIERLISRGACVSWSPKNLASSLISYSINWMVKHTQYRLFTAYSDPEANELGTIYQACNFYYLGQKSGTKYKYKYQEKVVSDRYFRSRSFYKRIAKELNIKWQNNWQLGDRVLFYNMPVEIEKEIKQKSKDYQNNADRIKVTPKHKYCYIKGRNKNETKLLIKKFKEKNKVLKYPKNRGV